jgi:hypothetical protein
VNVSRASKDTLAVDAPADPQLRALFIQLNNQLGIVLAHAELLEAKAADTMNRLQAEQVVRSVLDAMATARELMRRSEPVAAASLGLF